MLHRRTILFLSIGLGTIGLCTILTAFSRNHSQFAWTVWWVFLVLLPLTLGGAVWIGWAWAAMACVIYATIGLALDLATIISILGNRSETASLLALSGISGTLNLSLVIFGGLAFWDYLQDSRP